MTSPKLLGTLPESMLHSQWFAVLATLVALNTIGYVALAVAKLLPAVHPGDWWHRRERRSEDRSIHPDSVVVRQAVNAEARLPSASADPTVD